MIEQQIMTLKEHLTNYMLALNMAALLMDALEKNTSIKQTQARALVTAEKVKEQINQGDETHCMAMVVVARDALKQARSILLSHVMPPEHKKARREWLASTTRLLAVTRGVGK